jgi:hypothetical protein
MSYGGERNRRDREDRDRRIVAGLTAGGVK